MLDPRTFEAIEAKALLDTIDKTQTETSVVNQKYRNKIKRMGFFAGQGARRWHSSDYGNDKQRRSVTGTSVTTKTDCFGEIELNLELYDALTHFVGNAFSGGLAINEPSEHSDKLEFGGYGYRQYQDDIQFTIELVEKAYKLSRPQTEDEKPSLNLFSDIFLG